MELTSFSVYSVSGYCRCCVVLLCFSGTGGTLRRRSGRHFHFLLSCVLETGHLVRVVTSRWNISNTLAASVSVTGLIYLIRVTRIRITLPDPDSLEDLPCIPGANYFYFG